MFDVGHGSDVLIAWNNFLNVIQTVMLTYLAYRYGKRGGP